ncbi:MAG: PEP-CTERM sorting domain-containing protein [Isosphaeraceae bacterium]
MSKSPVCNTALRLLGLALAIVAASESAQAGHLVTFNFGGVINESETSRVPEGTPFSGTITYDLDADDEDDDPTYGSYTFPLPSAAPVEFSYTVGALTFTANEEAYLVVFNDGPRGDGLVFRGSRPGNNQLIDGQITLFGISEAVFSSDRPPGTLNLADFASAEFSGTFRVPPPTPRQPSSEYSFSGTIDTLALASVPEPSSLALMGTGVMAVLACALRRTWGGRAPRRTDR